MQNFSNFLKSSLGVRMQPGQAQPQLLLSHHLLLSMIFSLLICSKGLLQLAKYCERNQLRICYLQTRVPLVSQ